MYPLPLPAAQVRETARPSLASRVSVLLGVWKPILGIGEHVKVVITAIESADGEGEDDCAMFPASAVPESAGLWDFVLAISPSCAEKDDVDLERAVVHELTHLLMEPLREDYFFDVSEPIRSRMVERWETAIERISDTFIRVVDERR